MDRLGAALGRTRSRTVLALLVVAVLVVVVTSVLGSGPSSDPRAGNVSPTVRPTGTPSDPPTTASPTPTPRPFPRVTDPRLGVYNGPFDENPDTTTQAEFGVYPEVASSYYQPDQAIDVYAESERIRRGTSPNITVSTKGTQLLAGIANGDPAALGWLDRYVAELRTLAAVDPSVPVYGTLEHEFRAKTTLGLVTGPSAEPAVYGRALSAFYRRLHSGPVLDNLYGTYWFVGYDRPFEGAVADAFTVLPDAIEFDPYANGPSDSLITICTEDLDWIRTQSWYTGQPVGLGEFGMPVENGDAALQKFYSDLRPQMRQLGLTFAVLFNRPRDNNHEITTGLLPGAVSSFSASLRG